ncbi:ECF transporter S component [Thermoproteota archaeon]
MKNRKASLNTREISLSAVFSALAVMLTMVNLTIPFPLLPYLKFDFSEIPVTSAFFLIGPQYALLSSVIYWIVLTIRAGEILGPAMKFAAVASMIIGFWVASKVTNGKKTRDIKPLIMSGLVIGIILRVVVMSLFNYTILVFIAPFWLDYATGFIAVLGLSTANSFQTVLWVLVLTGFYNLLHTILSMGPSVFISKASVERVPNLLSDSWIAQYKNPKKQSTE